MVLLRSISGNISVRVNRELSREGTCWVFVADTDEPRHLHDIIFGVYALRQRGVPDRNILVFTDHPTPAPHFSPYGITPLPLADLNRSLAAVSGCDGAVLVATGHGGIEGIGAGRTVLTPHSLLAAVRSIPGLSHGAIVVCQCFAGVFDIVDAATSPSLVLVGSTRLTNSVSAPLHLNKPVQQSDGSAGLTDWAANIFMMAFFEWIIAPKDIDGDGRLTLADAYKFAGVLSNFRLIQLKSALYLEVRGAAARMEQLAALVRGPNPTAAHMLDFQAGGELLQKKLETLHLHQEPWILNATLSREVSFFFSSSVSAAAAPQP